MKPVKINYSVFNDLDIFLSHSNKPYGRLIRWATTLTWNPKDNTTPTHGGFITNTYGQFFATEMGTKLRENSLEKYTGKSEQLVQVWRCKGFADESVRIKARERLAYLRRLQKNYDLRGAIMSSKAGQAIFGWIPWFKNKPGEEFCTEDVANILRMFVDLSTPQAPNPLELSLYFKSKPSMYVPVEGFNV